MAILLTPNNISDFVGRQVFDTNIQNDYGVGTIVSTFNISGQIGVRVYYSLDRLVANDEDTMSGLIVNGPVSGELSGTYFTDSLSGVPTLLNGTVSGMPGTGQSYIRYDLMSDAYVAANPGVRGGSFIGMSYAPQYAGGHHEIGVFGTSDQRLVRKTYFDDTVPYYPENAAYASGLPSIYQLRVI